MAPAIEAVNVLSSVRADQETHRVSPPGQRPRFHRTGSPKHNEGQRPPWALPGALAPGWPRGSVACWQWRWPLPLGRGIPDCTATPLARRDQDTHRPFDPPPAICVQARSLQSVVAQLPHMVFPAQFLSARLIRIAIPLINNGPISVPQWAAARVPKHASHRPSLPRPGPRPPDGP